MYPHGARRALGRRNKLGKHASGGREISNRRPTATASAPTAQCPQPRCVKSLAFVMIRSLRARMPGRSQKLVANLRLLRRIHATKFHLKFRGVHHHPRRNEEASYVVMVIHAFDTAPVRHFACSAPYPRADDPAGTRKARALSAARGRLRNSGDCVRIELERRLVSGPLHPANPRRCPARAFLRRLRSASSQEPSETLRPVAAFNAGVPRHGSRRLLACTNRHCSFRDQSRIRPRALASCSARPECACGCAA